MGTPVIFVHNKTENDFKSMQRKSMYKNMQEEQLIHEMSSIIKENIYKELEKVRIVDPKVFLIEGYSLNQLDDSKFEEKELLKYAAELASASGKK